MPNFVQKELRLPLKLLATIAYKCSPRAFSLAALYDALPYPHYALGLQIAARHAKHFGIKGFSAIEFGVAGGRGLVALSKHAQQISRLTGLEIEVVGFDTGQGLPVSKDWRDVPWIYNDGDYPCRTDDLIRDLNGRADLRLGDVGSTFPQWLEGSQLPIGFASIDVDYYSSTSSILRCLQDCSTEKLVPISAFWMDDILCYGVPNFAGELAAMEDFATPQRRFSRSDWVTESRPYGERLWLRRLYEFYCLDHPRMNHQPREKMRLDLRSQYR